MAIEAPMESVWKLQFRETKPPAHFAPTDSPAGLAAWLLDQGDRYASAVLAPALYGHSVGALTREEVLDNITLYWFTNTVISSARLYWENKANFYLPAGFWIPAAVTEFPGERFGSAELGREGLSQADLLPPGRGRRSLRGVGPARHLQPRSSRGVPASARFDLKT
jgi:hypothetical protein